MYFMSFETKEKIVLDKVLQPLWYEGLASCIIRAKNYGPEKNRKQGLAKELLPLQQYAALLRGQL